MGIFKKVIYGYVIYKRHWADNEGLWVVSIGIIEVIVRQLSEKCLIKQ